MNEVRGNLATAVLLGMALVVTTAFTGGARPLYSVAGCGLAALGLALYIGLGAIRRPLFWPTLFVGLAVMYLGVRIVLYPHPGTAQIQGLALSIGAVFWLVAMAGSRSILLGIVWVSVVLVLVQVGIGIHQYVEGDQWMPWVWIRRADEFWRASGFFISPNHFAGFVEMSVCLSLGLVFWGNMKPGLRVLLGFSCVMGVIGVAISGSRGGYLAAAVGIGYVLILSLRAFRIAGRKFVPIAIVLSCVAAIAMALVTVSLASNPKVWSRAADINDPDNIRLHLWDSAIQQWRLNPVWGTGPGSYLHYGRTFRHPEVQNDPIHVHNDYLQVLSEYGTVGALLCGLALLCILGTSWSSSRAMAERDAQDTGNDTSLGLTIGAGGAIAALAVHSVVDFNLQIPACTALAGFCVGILCRGVEPIPVRLVPFGRILGSGLAAGVGVVFVAGLPKEIHVEGARYAMREGDIQRASALAQKAISMPGGPGSNPFLYSTAAEAQLKQGADRDSPALLRSASSNISEAIKYEPLDVEYRVQWAEILASGGEFDAARRQIDVAKSLDPHGSYTYAYSGVVEMLAGEPEEADMEFMQAIALGGTGAELARRLRGRLPD